MLKKLNKLCQKIEDKEQMIYDFILT